MPSGKLYQAWYCPFAQRAYIGLMHRGVDLEVVELDPYDKTPEWLAINPRGTVPALTHNGKHVYESTLVLDYLDDAWKDHSGPKILPEDAHLKFQAKLWGDHVDKKMIAPHYAALRAKTEEERNKYKQQILDEIKVMFDGKPDPNSKFFLGDKPGYVDFMLVPFVIRYLCVLKELRGFDIPREGYERFYAWYDNVLALDCVKKTRAEDAKIVEKYRAFFDGKKISSS